MVSYSLPHPQTAPMQLRLEGLVVSKTGAPPNEKDVDLQITTKDEPVKKNQATCKAKRKKGQKQEKMAREHNPQHEQWPVDTSIAKADKTVKEAKQWAIDTLNPNCGRKAAEYLKWTSADIALVQEVKVEEENRNDYEDAARGTGWKLAVQACLLGDKGGLSAGTAMGARSTLA